MRILRPVIGAQALLALTREANALQRCPVRSELYGDNRLRDESLLLEQLPQKFKRGGFVVPSPDKTENFAFAVDGPLHIHSLAANPDHHLVQMPVIVGRRSNAA